MHILYRHVDIASLITIIRKYYKIASVVLSRREGVVLRPVLSSNEGEDDEEY